MNGLEGFREFIEFVKYAKGRQEIGRRYIRDYSDPFRKYSVQEFRKRYRFSPSAVKNTLIPLLKSDLKTRTRRGMPFAPETLVLVTLSYFATSSSKKLDEVLKDVNQPSVTRITDRVAAVMAKKMRDFVKFPDTDEGINKLKRNFQEKAGFPDVIGCIGCTHVKIKNPGGDKSKAYKNKMKWYSLKVQAVTGPNSEFLDLVARWPGSTADRIIFNNSVLKQRLESGALSGTLLGLNGYETSKILLTPFSSPKTESQKCYNRSHNETRNVDKALETWKERFRCLKIGLGLKLEKAIAVICACATLHNLSIMLNDTDTIDDDEDDDDEELMTVSDVVPVKEDPHSEGFSWRQSVVDNYFSDTT